LIDDLDAAVPAPSAVLLGGVGDVRGVYDPRWVGHRTLVARAGDLVDFWRDLPAEMLRSATVTSSSPSCGRNAASPRCSSRRHRNSR